MAIARGAGTEIIRSAHFETLPGGTTHTIIFGVQHHIYTVLSVTVYCDILNDAADFFDLTVLGYDAYGGTTAQRNRIITGQVLALKETFVWNDKFSFNGHEPTDFAGPMDSVVKQDAIADQGSSVAQKLQFYPDDASSYYDVNVTYIDQNNA
jgi:hypothetical protein